MSNHLLTNFFLTNFDDELLFWVIEVFDFIKNIFNEMQHIKDIIMSLLFYFFFYK